VNETYLRLVEIDSVDWRDRVHFFAISANAMRRRTQNASSGALASLLARAQLLSTDAHDGLDWPAVIGLPWQSADPVENRRSESI
jgi:hypothetical protein